MKTRIGTSYFISKKAAIRYFKDYGYDAKAVEQKFERGEIHVGKPIITEFERLEIIPNEGRYMRVEV